MHQSLDSSAPHELSQLKAEIQERALGIRCVFTALNVLPLYYCTRVLLAAPRFEMIFEDMLGSKQKLPLLTQMVLQNAYSVLAGIWLIAVLAVILIFTIKRARFVWITAVTSALVFIATGHIIASVLMDPLVSVIQNLAGGSDAP